MQKRKLSRTNSQISLRVFAGWFESSFGAHVKIIYILTLSAKDVPLRKHTYSNILIMLPPKNEKIQIKKIRFFYFFYFFFFFIFFFFFFFFSFIYFFIISAQNIYCGYSLEPPWRGGSNGYEQSMSLSRNKKNNVCPCKPQFYYIKVGFKVSKLHRRVFDMYDF